MKFLYTHAILLLCLLCTWTVQAQRIVNIPAVPGNVVDMFPVISGDTTATGERTDNNTIYTLDNGGLYISTARLVNKKEWPLQIQAADLTDLDNKPIITRIPDGAGSYPQIAWPEGDMTLKNLWIISGERGPGEGHDWGQIRMLGAGTRHVVEDCIIEKDRGGFLQLRADSVKLFVNRCTFRNGGNRFILEGNGRGIDSRNFAFDSLVVKNTYIYNVIDRVFRSIGNTIPHNYIEFDHCTIFNIAGRHGFFNFEWVKHAKVTNCQLINPIMLGTSPIYTDEQNQPDNGAHKVFTVDTVTAATQFTFSNNNIFYSQDVLDAWVPFADSVKRPDVYSMLIKQVMGDDTLNSYIEEPLTLNSVPINITQYVTDIYTDPSNTAMFDHTVEDISAAGTNRDFGNLFDFATWDPCYAATLQSATAGTNGSSIGAVQGCPGLDAVGVGIEDELNTLLGLNAAPNPFTGVTKISFSLDRASHVKLTVFDLTGKALKVLTHGNYPAGEQEMIWDAGSGQGAGIYLLRLETEAGFMTKKLLLY